MPSSYLLNKFNKNQRLLAVGKSDVTVADTNGETEIVPQIPFLSFRAEKQHLTKNCHNSSL